MARKSSNGTKAEHASKPHAAHEAPASPAAHGDLAERVGQRVGNFTSRTLRGVFRAIGRVREEAEDVWAEAQALRHREAAASAEPAKGG